MTGNNLSLQTNEGWYLVAGFAIAIVAAAAVALASYSDINQYYNRVDWVTHTDVILRTLDAARGDTFGSVAALQTYYQSGDRKNLDQLALSVSELQRTAAALRVLTVDNESQQRRLDRVDQSARRVATLTHDATQSASTRYGARTRSACRFSSSSPPRFISSARNSTPCPWLNRRC